MNYKERLKELREYSNIDKKISQKEVADAIGIKRSTYNQFEQQYDIIPIIRLNQIANFFNVSIDYILGLTNDQKYKKTKTELNIDISSQRLKEFRKENKLTQAKLAEKIKASSSIIVHHETKRNFIGTPFLYTICKEFNISADYLLGRIDNPKYLK